MLQGSLVLQIIILEIHETFPVHKFQNLHNIV